MQSTAVLRDGGPDPLSFVMHVHDNSAAHEHAAQLAERYRLMAENSSDVIMLADLTGLLTWVSPSVRRVLGREPEDLVGTDGMSFAHPGDAEAIAQVRSRLRAGVSDARFEVRIANASGEYRWMSVVESQALDADGRVVGRLVSLRDNHEQALARQELADRASRDSLTGLLNRDQLDDSIARVLGRRRRRGGVPGLLYCDLDHFKQVNDTHGHEVGDEVLRETAARMTNALRADDLVARLGGDEFVVILREVFDMPAALVVAEKIRVAVRAPMRIGDRDLMVTMSVGVALATPEVEANRLKRKADAALYEAKRFGRDRARAFQEADLGADQ